MAQPPDTKDPKGNSANWFLELLGVEVPDAVIEVMLDDGIDTAWAATAEPAGHPEPEAETEPVLVATPDNVDGADVAPVDPAIDDPLPDPIGLIEPAELPDAADTHVPPGTAPNQPTLPGLAVPDPATGPPPELVAPYLIDDVTLAPHVSSGDPDDVVDLTVPMDEVVTADASKSDAGPLADPEEMYVSQSVVPSPIDYWSPEELSQRVSAGGRFRLPILIVVAVLVGLVTVVSLLLPQISTRRAATEAEGYSAALTDLRAALPEAQQVLASTTEPGSDTGDLATLGPGVTELDVASDALANLSTRPLPSTLPLVSRKALERLEPYRDAMSRAATDGSDIARRISAAIIYRLRVVEFLELPDLPVAADTARIDELGVTLAAELADSTGLLADLPQDVFSDHRRVLEDALTRFSDWQIAYLDALRTGDNSTAAALVAEITELQAGVDTALVPSLATLRREVDAAIIDLDADAAAIVRDLLA